MKCNHDQVYISSRFERGERLDTLDFKLKRTPQIHTLLVIARSVMKSQRLTRLTTSLRVMLQTMGALALFVSPYAQVNAAPAEAESAKTQLQPSLPLPVANASLASGPLVGFGGVSEVALWAQTTAPARVRFRYWPQGVPESALWSEMIKTHVAGHLIARTTLSGLTPQTKFSYEIWINEARVERPYPLKFQTQARWRRRSPPPDFELAVGSCAYIKIDERDNYGGGYEIFEQIRARSPDAMLWLGDNLYLGAADYTSEAGIWRRYSTQRAHPSLQALWGSVHHYAIWDDHDYGPNDANRSYPLKGVTLEAFKTFWPNPSFGLPELAGNFGTFSWSDVDFFLLDDRTFRAPYHGDPHAIDQPLLGTAQLRWLLDALSNSRATFKVIAIGSQVLNPFSRFEGYSQHARERDQLLSGIKSRRVEGVIFLSGDRHFAELNRVHDDPQFYPLYDFTSSPLTSGLARSVGSEINNPRRVSGTLVNTQRNFGMLRFKGRDATRAVTLETWSAAGERLWSHTIYARDLKIK